MKRALKVWLIQFTSFARTKTNALYLGITLCYLVLMLTLAAQLYHSYHHEIEQAKTNAENLNRALEMETVGTFRALDELLLGLADVVQIQTPRATKLARVNPELLDSSLRKFPEVTAIRLFNTDGDCVQSAGPDKCKFSVADREFFIAAKSAATSKLEISGPLVSKVTGAWVLILSRRLATTTGAFAGVVIAVIPLEGFQRQLSKLNVGEHGSISLLNAKEATLLYRYPILNEVIGTSFAKSDFFREFRAQGTDSGTIRVVAATDGELRMFSYRVIRNLNLIITVGLADRDYLKAWSRNSLSLGLLSLFTLILFIYLLRVTHRTQAALDSNRVQLAKSAKMSALGEMASAVAHEINNPLAIISGQAHMIRSATEELQIKPGSIERRVEKIEQTVGRVAKIVAGLRAFSRSGDADPFELAMPREIIEQTIDMCKTRLLNEGIELRSDLTSLQDLRIECRSVQVSQTILNLLSNAADAIGGTTNKWISIETQTTAHAVRIVITDSGHGIPAKVVEHMMEPFYSTKPVGKGTGLGLSISKGLIESNGGSLEYNALSPNTSFVILLPIRQPTLSALLAA